MFAATDTEHAPWHVAPSNDKKRVRLNIISHLLKHVPYKEIKTDKPKLPARQERGDYQESNHPFKVIPEPY
jgi:hypothetical protein